MFIQNDWMNEYNFRIQTCRSSNFMSIVMHNDGNTVCHLVHASRKYNDFNFEYLLHAPIYLISKSSIYMQINVSKITGPI